MARALASGAIGAHGTGDCATATTVATSACRLGSITSTPAGVTDGLTDAIANWSADVKVTNPSGAVTGTVVFFPGAGGNSWWENAFPNSVASVIDPALARGQRVIQVKWVGNGWDAGTEGALALAARPATLLRAIYADASLYTPGTPFCVVGQSSGSSQICYSLCHYGLGDYIDLAVLCSGPPQSRIDYGVYGNGLPTWNSIGPALCTTGTTITYSASEQNIITNSYTGRTYASAVSISGGIDNPGTRDSILRADAELNFPNTTMVFVFGDGDSTAACPLGRHFATQVKSAYTENITTGGVTHSQVPNSTSGMAFINSALAAASFRH